MTRDELIELVKKIQSFAGTEDEVNSMIDLFLEKVPDPKAINYLHKKEYESWSVEEIVDKALSYKPFQL